MGGAASRFADTGGKVLDLSGEAVGQAGAFHAAGQLGQDILGDRFKGSKGLGVIGSSAATGAAIGSIVPFIGTAWGAGIGAAFGAIKNLSSVTGFGLGGHNDRKVESSWHPAVLDALYQAGVNLRENVPKDALNRLAKALGIPEKDAFRGSPGTVESQDKKWEKEVKAGRMSWADVNEMSLSQRKASPSSRLTVTRS